MFCFLFFFVSFFKLLWVNCWQSWQSISPGVMVLPDQLPDQLLINFVATGSTSIEHGSWGSRLVLQVNGATNGAINWATNWATNWAANGAANGATNGATNWAINWAANGASNWASNGAANGASNRAGNRAANGATNGDRARGRA
jgi:hypothetical protein